MKVEHNIQRLKYLMSLYTLTEQELLSLINDGYAKVVTRNDIFSPEIKVGYLKRIDKIFNKGLHYYLDPKSPEVSKDASIFFRKSEFNAELNIGAKKIVNKFEEFKISLSAMAKLAEISIDRILPVYTLSHSPSVVAATIRQKLYPHFNAIPKEFLRALIGKFAENNILVFEFVETWNKKEKANIDGFFLAPNVIVLKRQQISFRREIFTLIHELGHYLLNEEEVEELDVQSLANTHLSATERWCNEFAYHFLIGNYENAIKGIASANGSNDYHFSEIKNISTNTHLSTIALFTRLLYEKKLSQRDYNVIKNDFDRQFHEKQEKERRLRELEREQGIKARGSAPKPMNSPLLVSTIQTAFYEGVIGEYEVCKTLNIKPEKLDHYLNESSN